jgi:ribonuclease H2 subunit A
MIEGEGLFCGTPRVHVPEACKGVEVVIGVDEAGRGPVLGSLVYCAAFWPASMNDEISALGFDDSKQLKEGEREKLFNRIKAHDSIGWVIAELTAEVISKQMLKATPQSLNALSYEAVVWMLEKIRDYPNNPPIIDKLFIDTVGDPDTYKWALQRGLGPSSNDWDFTIEKKADANYRVTSAASIIAKQTRDMQIATWKWREPNCAAANLTKEFGSGYPSDPQCVSWMKGDAFHPVFGYPSLVRFSWGTAKTSMEDHGAATVSWECDEDDMEGAPAITKFFGSVSAKRPTRSPYFVKRGLKHVIKSDL